MRLPRKATVGLMVGVVLVAVPSAAAAAPPDPSAISVSATTVHQGDTFTIAQDVYNPNDSTLVGGMPTLYGLVDLVDIVSCTNSIFSCGPNADGLRAYVGDLAPGATKTVVWTLRVKDDAQPGPTQLRHQLDGESFAFPAVNGPILTITGTPQAADLGVGITAPRGLLTGRVEYSVTVTNRGPGDATAVRLVATYAAGLQWAGSTSCTRTPNTRTVTCDIAQLNNGQTKTVKFATNAGLLALGPFTTTAQRQQSTPADPDAANDRASKTCSALTGLLVSC
ncbi:hypothetical protein [Actinophytocola sp.]|jgi:hypothetical protein|uniref:hypothetical protein n=1 Tax=Actinophytocola sp. TaxID=1872138 RepID=UPI002EDAB928